MHGPKTGRDNGSWWIGAPQVGFTAVCFGELERMAGSKFSGLKIQFLFEVAEERRRKKAAVQLLVDEDV